MEPYVPVTSSVCNVFPVVASTYVTVALSLFAVYVTFTVLSVESAVTFVLALTVAGFAVYPGMVGDCTAGKPLSVVVQSEYEITWCVTMSTVAVRLNVTVSVTGLAACLPVPAYVYVIVSVTVFVKSATLSGLFVAVSVRVLWAKTILYTGTVPSWVKVTPVCGKSSDTILNPLSMYCSIFGAGL